MSDVNEIRKKAKELGIDGRELLAVKKEVEALYAQQQDFIDSVRQTAFRAMTGRTDRFWMIFGHESDRKYGKIFHGGGDYSTIHGWDDIAKSVFANCPGLCQCEEDASEALWDFVRYQPFRIPTTADLYKEAAKRLADSVEQVA